MKKIKRALKLISFVVLLFAAAVGVGINGAILPSFRRPDKPEIKIELFESKDEEGDLEELEQKG